MGDLINGIEFLNIPMTVAIALVGLFLVLQIIGELLEFKGKVAPEFRIQLLVRSLLSVTIRTSLS